VLVRESLDIVALGNRRNRGRAHPVRATIGYVAHWVSKGLTMVNDRSNNDATKEYLDLANRCLIEACRTLDREAAQTLRHLAKRYFKEADRHKEG
jgi:hypothetical protein